MPITIAMLQIMSTSNYMIKHSTISYTEMENELFNLVDQITNNNQIDFKHLDENDLVS